MTQEEKQLLLKDLCARLPYGVKCNGLLKQIDGSLKSVFGTFTGYNGWATVGNNLLDIETVRPYLRPMSSMTEKEKRKYDILVEEIVYRPGVLTCSSLINFCYEHHLDDLGLIEKGLALVAPKDMYKTE